MTALKEKIYRHLPYIGILTLFIFLIYYDYWVGNKYFAGSDFFFLIAPLLNWQNDCLQELSWPLWNSYMGFGFPYVEHFANSTFFPTHLIMGLFTGSNMQIIHWEILLWILLCGIAMYLCVIEFGYSRITGIIAGTSFMFCSQMNGSTGWAIFYYLMASFLFQILGYLRAKKAGTPFSPLAIAFLTISILAGYASGTIVGFYLLTGYVIFDSIQSKKYILGLKFLSITLILSVLLTLHKIIPLYFSIADTGRLTTDTLYLGDIGSRVTFYNFISSLIPVKHYFSLYIGELSVLTLLYALVKRKIKIDALLLMVFISGWLFIYDENGQFSSLRHASNVLPLMKALHNEFQLWLFTSIFAILYLSRYFDDFLAEKNLRVQLITITAYLLLISFFFFREYNIELYYKAYLIHFGLAFLWFFSTFLYKRKNIQTVAVVLLLLVDFMIVFNRTNIDLPPRRDGAYMEMILHDQYGASSSFRDNSQYGKTWHFRVLQDKLRPSISDSRQWPYLNSGTDSDYTNNMNLKKFNGHWYITQYRKGFRELWSNKQWLVEQMDGWPLFSLNDRITGMTAGLVSFDKISCSDFSFTVRAEMPAYFFLNQIYDDRWKVLIDGNRQQPLLRANEYFMGVEVEPGEHKIEFKFSDKMFNMMSVVSLITLMGILFTIIYKRFRRKG